jgi:predicted Na+-dependent transporter
MTGMGGGGALLGASMIGGLAVGMLAPEVSLGAAGLTLWALGFQTLLTVGSLPSLGGREAAARGIRLLGLHVVTLSGPLVGAAFALDLSTPIGFGVFVTAVAPPAALVPAFAEVMDLDVAAAVAFSLLSYSAALVVTPAALLLATGATVPPDAVLTVLALGLLGPTILGRAAHRWLERVPAHRRQAAVCAAVFVITLSLGGDLLPSLSSSGVTPARIALVVGLIVVRTVGTGWVAGRLAPTGLRAEGTLAGSFKNIALSAGASAQLMGSAAAIPSLLSFPGEALYFMYLSHRWRENPKISRRMLDSSHSVE